MSKLNIDKAKEIKISNQLVVTTKPMYNVSDSVSYEIAGYQYIVYFYSKHDGVISRTLYVSREKALEEGMKFLNKVQTRGTIK